MSCKSQTLKFLLLILNILCCIFGFFALSASIYVLVEFPGSEALKNSCIWEISLCSILVLTSILGFCGTKGKSIRLLWTYVIIMLTLLTAQLAVIFFKPLAFNYMANEIVTIKKMWNSNMESDYKMTMYEIKYECCGKSGPKDYTEAGLPIPLSCYPSNNDTIKSNVFIKGCVTKLTEKYKIDQKIEEISDWTLVSLEGASSFVAALLMITLKNIRRRKIYKF